MYRLWHEQEAACMALAIIHFMTHRVLLWELYHVVWSCPVK